MGLTSSSTSSSASRAPILQRSRNFQWYFNATAVDSQPSTNEEWIKFSDIENEIIDDAMNTRKLYVEIDGNYVIDLKEKTKCKKDAPWKQWSVKRVQLETDRTSSCFREQRLASPLLYSSASPTSRREGEHLSYDFPVFKNLAEVYYLQHTDQSNKHAKTVEILVEEAAQGIVKEGTVRDKTHEANWLAKQLLAVKHYGRKIKIEKGFYDKTNVAPEIGETCINLYTKNSFWFTLLNEVMREPEKITHEQIMSLAPFSFLLNYYIYCIAPHEPITVYRGLTLSDEQLENFVRKNGASLRSNAFTSTSKSRMVAEMFSGNTLLIIDVKRSYFLGAHIATMSDFPDEEEVLLLSGTTVYFVDYNYDNENKRHIYHYEI